MEERRYTLKELYEYVTEYSRESREEKFDSSVGDFVDWIASQETQQEECDHIGKCELYLHCKDCSHVEKMKVQGETSPTELLPEKLRTYKVKQIETDEEVDAASSIELTRAVNEIIDYLKEINI